MNKFLILNGPNLNLLGVREPDKYGHETLADIETNLSALAEDLGVQVAFFQSNAEHEIIQQIHLLAKDPVNAIIINPAAFTHTSIAIRDAILSINVPFYEVHLSNVYQREPFRHKSYFSDIAKAVICGMGSAGYEYALRDAIRHFNH